MRIDRDNMEYGLNIEQYTLFVLLCQLTFI